MPLTRLVSSWVMRVTMKVVSLLKWPAAGFILRRRLMKLKRFILTLLIRRRKLQKMAVRLTLRAVWRILKIFRRLRFLILVLRQLKRAVAAPVLSLSRTRLNFNIIGPVFRLMKNRSSILVLSLLIARMKLLLLVSLLRMRLSKLLILRRRKRLIARLRRILIRKPLSVLRSVRRKKVIILVMGYACRAG